MSSPTVDFLWRMAGQVFSSQNVSPNPWKFSKEQFSEVWIIEWERNYIKLFLANTLESLVNQEVKL